MIEFSPLRTIDERVELKPRELQQDLRVLRVTQRDHAAVGSELYARAAARTVGGLDPFQVWRGFHLLLLPFSGITRNCEGLQARS